MTDKIYQALVGNDVDRGTPDQLWDPRATFCRIRASFEGYDGILEKADHTANQLCSMDNQLRRDNGCTKVDDHQQKVRFTCIKTGKYSMHGISLSKHKRPVLGSS